MKSFRHVAPDPSTDNLRPRSQMSISVTARRKTEQACTSCRTLRRKCTGQSPCQNCLENKLHCSYGGEIRAPEKLTLARAVKRIAKLEERLRVYEESGTARLPVSLNRDSSAILLDYGKDNVSAAQEDDMDQLLRGVNYLTISKNPEFYGGSSLNAIINEVETLEEQPNPSTGANNSVQPSSSHTDAWLQGGSGLRFADVAGSFLPPRSVADAYVNRYFQTAHHVYPILDKLIFMDRYENFWAGLPTEGQGYELWIAVFYMVMAHGHQCTTIDPDIHAKHEALQRTDGEMCFEMAKLAFAEVPFRGGDLSAASSMFLGFVWLYNQQRFHEAYAMLGAAARVGYATGLHRQRIPLGGQDITAINSLWWCLFIYETELATFSGRPCAIQPHEVDVKPFSLDASPISLQYIERLRQFSHLTWDAYEKVYGLSYKHASLGGRIDALRAHDSAFVTWFNTWQHDSVWSREPYGLILKLRYLNIRILLHRAFLNLTILRTKKGKEIREELISAAASCVEMAISFVKMTTESIHVGSSGIIQASLFHVIGYLWNATMTLLLYAKSKSVHAALCTCGILQTDVVAQLESAIKFFAIHQEGSSTARMAVHKVEHLMGKSGKDSQRGPSSASPESNPAPNLESPDQILDFVTGFPEPFIFADASFPNIFMQPASSASGDGEGQQLRTGWGLEDDPPPLFGGLI